MKVHLTLTHLTAAALLASSLATATSAEPEASLSELHAAGDALREGFVDYIKAAANPDNHGLRADGRFYPYSSPQGRRIGYRQPIADKKLYREGWSAAEAERALREQLQAVAAELRVRLRSELRQEFDELPRASREILLDFGLTEGVARLKPEFVAAVVRLDWKQILDPDFYARYEADWPDSVRNKAFYERWHNPENRP